MPKQALFFINFVPELRAKINLVFLLKLFLWNKELHYATLQ